MVRAYKVSGKMTLDKGNWTTTLSGASREVRDFAGRAERSFAGIKRSWGTLSGQMSGMISSLGAGFSAVEILKAGDAYQAMQRRIKMATEATGDFGRVSAAVYDISQRTFSRLGNTELTFRMFNMMNREIRASNTEILKVTDTVNKLGALGGVTNEQLSGGVRQFTQVMGKGRLMAQELNIIMENMPMLGNAIVRGLGMSQGQMRKLMEEGKVSSQMVFQAILREAANVDKQFASFAPTLGQRWNQVYNAFQKTMGQDTAGPIKAIDAGMVLIRDHMKEIEYIGGAGLAVMGVNVLRRAVGSLADAAEWGFGNLRKMAGQAARMSGAGAVAPSAARAMTLGDAKGYLDLEAQARAKGVYISVSDAVRAADAKRLDQMRALGTVTREAAAAQTVHLGKAAAESTKWGTRIAEAERRVQEATAATAAARRRFDFMSTVENHKALTTAIQAEAAATASLGKVQASAATAAATMAARGEKLGASWAVKLGKAEKAASVAAEGAVLLRAKEIAKMEEMAGKGLAAAAIRDGESAAVVRYMRLIDLETAAKGRSALATVRMGTVSAAAAKAGTLMKGAWNFVGGLPGAIMAAVIATGGIAYAVSKVRQAMDPLTKGERAKAKNIDEYITQQRAETATPQEQKVEKESEALKNLREQRELLRTLQGRKAHDEQARASYKGGFYVAPDYPGMFSPSAKDYDVEIETQKKRIAELEKLFQQTQSAAPSAAQQAAQERQARLAEEQAKLTRQVLDELRGIRSNTGRPAPGSNWVPSTAP